MREPIKYLFLLELRKIFKEAKNAGISVVEIRASDLAERAGKKYRIPACCNAMRSIMTDKDQEILRPTVQKDSTTNIYRYDLSGR
nr:hypothetical protein [uncultured Cohaesibacter sp.]